VRRSLRRHDLVQPIQNASDSGNAEALVFFLFDLLHLDGETITVRPLKERKERFEKLLSGIGSPCITAITRSGAGAPSTIGPAR